MRGGARLAACMALVLMVSTGAASVMGTSTADSTTYLAPAGLTSQAPAGLTPSQCTSDGAKGCKAQLPCSSGACPTVDVSPNVDLQDGQSVSINATNFPSTDSFRVALCSGVTSSSDPSCLTGLWEDSDYQTVSVPVTDDAAQQNLTTITYPVFDDPAGEGNSLLPALDILDLNNETPGFYCDDSANPCDIVVTEEVGQGAVVGLGPAVDTTNSVVIPLTFRAQTNGCPGTTPVIYTDGATTVQQLLPTAVQATCKDKNGVVALNTTTDTRSVVSDLAVGNGAVGFIDNPQDAGQMALLKHRGYALVPVAVSASTVAFLAGDIENSLSVPISTYNLTPNMVAGLITSDYQYPSGSPQYMNGKPYFADADNLTSALAAAKPPVTCAQLYECPTTNVSQQLYFDSNLDAFDLLNSLSANAVKNEGITPQQFGSFMPDVPTGASYQTTDWLCHAPNPALTATVMENGTNSDPVAAAVTVDDPNLAATTLTTAPSSSVWPPSGDSTAKWVFPTCQGISNFPSISGSSNFFSAAQSPALQANKMRSWAYGGGEMPSPQNGTDPLAAFGIMDSSQAAFYGLNEASLENASGNFVAPTTASVEAGLTAAEPCTTVSANCPANTYQFNYSNPDPTAYPMPDITYAIVPTSPESAATTAAIRNLITNLVDFSNSGTLPAGYYPMPAAMTKAALADLQTALHTVSHASTHHCTKPGVQCPVHLDSTSPDSSTPGSTPSSLPATSVVSTSATSGSSGSNKDDRSPVDRATPSHSSSKHKAQPATLVIPTDLSLIGLNLASRLLLPFALLLALLCLAGGIVVLRRTRAARTTTSGKDP
jgi:hypothetical protein